MKRAAAVGGLLLLLSVGVLAAAAEPPASQTAAREAELERIRGEIADDAWFEREGRPRESRELFEQVALSEELGY